mmetsp:Transcript_119666/g.334003  ORF Transcript_119666/g.334003 Transcript_119666/m.334003 type:complete len:438 (+) Transcript_119666:70-1383(+)
MIYVFNCAREACALPGKLCEECARCCDQLDCRPCEEFAKQCSEACSNYLNKPLGTYVLVALALSGAELFFCLTALLQPDLLSQCVLAPGSSGTQVGIKHWLYVQLSLAWLNLIFAPYIQQRLWRKLHEEAAEDGSEVPVPQPEITMARVKESFHQVFLYDIGVCLYVFSLLLSFGWSYMGSEWLEGSPNPACDPEGGPAWAASLGMFFVLFVLVYTAVWMLYMECMTTMYLGRAPYMRSRQATQNLGAHYGYPGTNGQPYPTMPAGNAPMDGMPGRVTGMHQAFQMGDRSYKVGAPGPMADSAPGGHVQPPFAHAGSAAWAGGYPGEEFLPPRQTGLQRACTPGGIAKLAACLGLDFCGNASYFLPVLGEGFDLAYAPAQAVALKLLFSSNSVAVIGLVEELLPFTDLLPTATIAWVLETLLPEHPLTRLLGLAREC